MRVIVVGAGISGLVAARRLADVGVDVTVVERADVAGGRLTTVQVGAATADAGAQFFTVRTPAFGAQVDDWLDRGLVGVWCRGFAVEDGHPRYVATGGMQSLAADLASGLDVRYATMAFAVHPRQDGAIGWTLVTDDGRRHAADALVLTTPLPQSWALLADTGVMGEVDLDGRDYDRTIAWIAELDRPPSIPPPGGAQSPADGVAFVADNQAKGVSSAPSITLHADPVWSERHWDDDRTVLTSALRTLAAPWTAATQVCAERVVRWRFATPRRIDPDPCWTAADRRIVLAGDAFAGPRVEGAHNSGLAAAHALTG
jgi:renalase